MHLHAEDDSLIGAALDERYLIDCVLGEGGMARVYRAWDRREGRVVAIKVLRAALARDRDFMDRFAREAMAVSRIASERVVRIVGVGVLPDGSRYYAMEHLVGETLEERRMRLGVLPLHEVISIAQQIAEGLGAAHAQGVVHRDLKPDNVMVTEIDGRLCCKIVDFGIAKFTCDNYNTVPGAVLGTPLYMAPEQATGGTIDARTDVYALGVVLYELATGQPPFDGTTPADVMLGHISATPRSLRALHPGLPVELETLVHICLAKRPAHRYASMREVAAALADVPIDSRSSSAPPASRTRGGTLVMAAQPADSTSVWHPARNRRRG